MSYPHAEGDAKGKCSLITKQECLERAACQDEECTGDKYWEKELAESKYLPNPEPSPVNFSYWDAGSTLTVPYHVVGPMAWEYPYHSGQAQEDLPDRLVPASLDGLKVVRPGYLLAFDRPATLAQATAGCDSGKGYADHISDTDVNKHAHPAGYVGQSHQGRALFVCPQPQCTVAGGHSFLFATLEQCVAHWNTFHVAVAPLFHCMVRVCDFETTAASDLLIALFHHFIEAHPSGHANGEWPNLMDLVVRGLHVKPNTQYWPPTAPLGDLQHPVAVTNPSAAQMLSPIVAARWAARENFHHVVVSHRRSIERLSTGTSRVESVAIQLPRVPLKPLQSLALKCPLNQRKSEFSFAALLMKLPPPPRKLNHLARREEGAVMVRVAQRAQSLFLEKGVNIQGRRLACLKSHTGALLTKFPNGQLQTPVSVLRLKPIVNLTSKSDRKRRPLRRVHPLPLTKGQTLRSRLGEGPPTFKPLPPSDLPLDHWANHRPGDDHPGWPGDLSRHQATLIDLV